MRLSWAITDGQHPVGDSLGELSGVAVDLAGNVYVSDFSATKIWVFDARGRQQPSIGRKGRGPGEFEAPTGLGIAPDGRLYVRDITRVSRFAADPETGRLDRYFDSFVGPTYADWRSTQATRFDNEGRLYYPRTGLVRTRRTGTYLRYTLAGQFVDSLEIPAFADAPGGSAFVRLSASGGRMLAGLSHVPFAPLPTWDVTPRGTLLLGSGASYDLQEQDESGRVLRVFRRQVAADRIPRGERRDSLAALRSRVDSVPVPLSQVQGMPPEVPALRLPTTYPPYMAAYAAPDGYIWVRRWPVGGSGAIFDVFEAGGQLRTVVLLPRPIAVTPTPVLRLDCVVGISVDRETGAHGVLRFVPSGDAK